MAESQVMRGVGPALTQQQAAQRKRIRVSTVVIFLGCPLVIALSVFLGSKEWYLPLSLLMLAMIMTPFFLVFERRRPKAREIVLIAMMSAITVLAHTFCHVLVPVQIGTALVILSGISLGPEAGFLIGALSRVVINFTFGQGPWTPWQMFCWGLLGFLAGLAFNRGGEDKANSRVFSVVAGPVLTMVFAGVLAYVSWILWPGSDTTPWGWRMYAFGAGGLLLGTLLQRKRLPIDSVTLTLFTFFTTFVLYGGLMNLATMATSIGNPGAGNISVQTVQLLYISGLPYDLLHAGTASLCVFLFGGTMIGKLERIKIKYGIYK